MSDLSLESTYPGGSSDQLVPGTPKTLLACGYQFNYLRKSIVLTPSHAQHVLNSLPAGLSVSHGVPTDSYCWDHTDSDTSDADDAATTALRFIYANSSTTTLRARLGMCGPIGVTNGARTGQRLAALVDLINDIGVSGGAYKINARPAK